MTDMKKAKPTKVRPAGHEAAPVRVGDYDTRLPADVRIAFARFLRAARRGEAWPDAIIDCGRALVRGGRIAAPSEGEAALEFTNRTLLVVTQTSALSRKARGFNPDFDKQFEALRERFKGHLPASVEAHLEEANQAAIEGAWPCDWRTTIVYIAALHFHAMTGKQPTDTNSPYSFRAFIEAIWSALEVYGAPPVNFTRTINAEKAMSYWAL